VKLISAASAMIAIAINFVSFSVGVKPNKAPTYEAAPNATAAIVTSRAQA